VTVYSRFHSSCPCCAVSPSSRGFGPGLRGAKGRPSRRSSIAIHSGLPSGRPMVGPLDPGRRRRVGRHREKRRKTGDQRAQRRHRCELVILARELRPGGRPWPVFGTAHQPRDHRIESDVTRGRQQMRLVHHHRAKATLEQMARPPEASVDGAGVAPVRFGKSCPQPIRARRRRDQVGMIGRWT
jgi:hypothetical protein